MNPLKQGLKPPFVILQVIFFHTVKEVNPLKQGLKHRIFRRTNLKMNR